MSRRFLRQTVSLGVSYTLGTFNDNFFKQGILLLAVSMGHTAVQAWGTVLFSLPFVLFSAWAGWLADRYPKCRLVLAAKALEVCAMLAGGWGLLQLHWSGMLAMLFCMGASATLFSPALNGSLPELFAREDVPRVNALFKLATTASILLGITLAGGALERQWLTTEIPFGRWLVAAVAVGVAVLGLLSVFFIPYRPAAARKEDLPPFPWLGALDSARDLWRLRARQGIFWCLCGDVFFYTLSTLVLLEINAYGVAQLGLGPTMASLLPGGLMLGICAGAGLAARRTRGDWRRSVPRACAGIGLLLAVAGGVPAAPEAFRFGLLFACYAAVGICGSLYIVPVSSQIQLLPAAEEKGRILGTSNFFSFSGMALAGPVYALLSFLPPSVAHMLLGGLTLIWAVFLARRLKAAFPDGDDGGSRSGTGDDEGKADGPRGPRRTASRARILFSRMLLGCGRYLLSLRYRVRLEGLDVLQAEVARARERGRGVLVLPNHPAFMDPALLCTHLAAFDLRPLADSHQIHRPWLRPVAALTGCISLPDLRRDGLSARDQVREALDGCAAALARGENVLLYPSGGLSRDGATHLGGNSGAYRLLQAVPDCGLVLVRTRGLWGSSFSWAAGEPVLGRALLRGLVSLLCHGLFFLPRREVRITCALPSRRPVAGEGVRPYNALLESFYDADGGEKACPQILFPWRAEVPSGAGTGAVSARMAATPPPLAAADREAVLRLLAEASPLGPEWGNLKEDQRLDTDLGLDSLALTELAVRLEERFGHAPATLEGLRTVGDCLLLAAGQMQEAATAEAPEEPSPWLDAVRARPARALSLPDAPNLPLVMLRQLRRAPSRPLLADNGRILTARAFWIRAVALSLHLRRRLGSGQRVGIMLPPFHTLGLTGNIVLPLCFGVPVVFHANPTEGARLDAVCRQWRPTLLVAAPTFLDGMLRQARPGDLASLRVAFVGAEACPQRLYDDFARLSGGGLLCEGYGVTECSPVISLNLPTDARTGTIGQPLPSVRTAIVSVQEPRQRLAAGETGLLLVRGPNVFGGYLGQGSDGGPASPFLHLDGEDWYCTGDLVRADSDGHMTFAGRRERFVKLGGEMISLPQMEAALGRHFMAPAGQEGPVLAVDALEEEGQTVLVLFTTLPLEREQANAVLREEGLSALYMLRRVRRLAALPLLGSGKVDYRSLRALAMQEGQGV